VEPVLVVPESTYVYDFLSDPYVVDNIRGLEL